MRYKHTHDEVIGTDCFHQNEFRIGDTQFFLSIKDATRYAISNSVDQITWINNDMIITITEMMNPDRAKFWMEIIQECESTK